MKEGVRMESWKGETKMGKWEWEGRRIHDETFLLLTRRATDRDEHGKGRVKL